MKTNTEIELDGEKYLVSLYAATRGFKLLTKLAKYLGRPMVALGASGGMSANVTPELITSLFDASNDLLDENILEKLVKEILDGVQIIDQTNLKNRPINFDLDFRGKYSHLFKLVAEVLQFQYSDFLSVLIARTKDLGQSDQETPNRAVRVKAKAS